MTRSEITFWICIAVALMLSYFVLAATAGSAHATDWDWSITDNYHTRQQPRRKARRYVRRTPDRDYERERDNVRLYRSEELVCAPGPVRGLGTQWIGQEGALDAAKKDFMERVRYDLGESYLDLKNAQDPITRCGRVSVGEVAGQVLYRCEIRAIPCKPKFNEGAVVGK
jgi:hypothetical protein